MPKDDPHPIHSSPGAASAPAETSHA
jgi:hypothetical protein